MGITKNNGEGTYRYYTYMAKVEPLRKARTISRCFLEMK